MEASLGYWWWVAAAVAVAVVTVRVYKQTHSPNRGNAGGNPATVPDNVPEKQSEGPAPMTAKKAFLSNLDRFIPLLPQLDGKMNIEAWTEQIVDIYNPNLLDKWKQCCRYQEMWRNVLASWGLKEDLCRTFTYLPGNAAMYDTADGQPAQVGERYRVERGCWILSTDTDGEPTKRVVLKGIITKA